MQISADHAEASKLSGLYKITNKINGKVYIGSSVKIEKRFLFHRTQLRGKKHHSSKLQRAWNKYGEESFEFFIIMTCDKEDLLQYEQRLLDAFNATKNGYNVCKYAGSALGRVHKESSKRKVSESLKGHTVSTETRKKLRDRNLGKSHSEETRKKIGEISKAMVRTPQHAINISNGLKRHAREKREKLFINQLKFPV